MAENITFMQRWRAVIILSFFVVFFQKVFEHIGTDAINFDQFCKALEALKQHATGQ